MPSSPPIVDSGSGASASVPPAVDTGSGASAGTPPIIAGGSGASASAPPIPDTGSGASAGTVPTVAGASGASAAAVPIVAGAGSSSPGIPAELLTAIYYSGSSFMPPTALFPAPTLVQGRQAWTNTGEDLPGYPRMILRYGQAEDLYYLELTLSDSIDYTWEQSGSFFGAYAPFDGDPSPPPTTVAISREPLIYATPPTVAGAASNSPANPGAITPET